MRPRWRKVLHDLMDNTARTLLVVFSIAVGVFSIGVIAGAHEILQSDMGASYASNQPANIDLRTADFNEDVLQSIRNRKDIEAAEGRRVFNVRVRVPGSGKWSTLDLIAFDDFEANQVNLLLPIDGKSAPEKKEVILERDALDDLHDVKPGDMLEFEMPDGSIKTLPMVGIVQDPATGAGDFLASPFGYINRSTLPFFDQPEDFNRVYATVTTGGDDEHHIHEVVNDLKDRLEKNGTTVIRTRISLTHEHPLTDTVNAVLGVLLALGVLIVFLSSSLIANTMNALLNQHLRHIGVIKLIGGRRRQVLAMYFVLILGFSALALLISVPLGGQGAYGLALFISDQLNFNLLGYRIVPLAFTLQVAVGLIIPLVAGMFPVRNGSKITILKALSGELGRGESSSGRGAATVQLPWFDRIQIRFTRLLGKRGIHIPRLFIISMRNTFRRKSRLLLTLFTLTMGGAIFIAVFNVRVTLHDYINAIGHYFRADVTLDLDYPYRVSKVEQYAVQVPGVERVEGWQFISAELLYPDETAADNINIFAPPAETELISPILIAGRWMQSEDVRKLVISEAVLHVFPNLKPGSPISMKVDGKVEEWEVIGIFKFVGHEGMLGYAPLEYISKVNNLPNQSMSYRVVTEQHDRVYQDKTAELLDRYFREHGFSVRKAESGLATMDIAVESLDTLVVFLFIMAVLTAIVGSMGLTGTMGMNVLERTREIGILRAIGADDRAVMRTVIAEGILIGMISFGLAVIFSVPITYLLSRIVSLAVFESPITTVFTYSGYLIWLGLVLVLSAIACILPARNAARLTIREVLAYE